MGIQSRPSNIFLSTNNILDRVSALEIFRFYIPSFKGVDSLFSSELRQDKSPSCKVYVWEGTYLYKDFAKGTALNCFQYVMNKFGYTFSEALSRINADFNLELDNSNIPYKEAQAVFNKGVVKPIEAKKERKIIEIVPRNWKVSDQNLWKTWGIKPSTLRKFEVVPLQAVYVNNVITYYPIQSPAYAFLLFGRFKIYRPLEKGPGKWKSNTYSSDIQGWKQLPSFGDTLVITSSLKDVMFLYQIGIRAIAPHGESAKIDPNMIKHLEKRFKRIVFLYDNDWNKEKNWGQIAAEAKAKEFGKENIVIPSSYESSDPTDLVKNVGVDDATIILQNLIL